MAPFDAVVEATVQRSRPVILTALAAMLAFIWFKIKPAVRGVQAVSARTVPVAT